MKEFLVFVRFAIVVGTYINIALIVMYWFVSIHPALGPAWMLMVITAMFLFVVQKTDNTVNRVFSRWVFQGTLKE